MKLKKIKKNSLERFDEEERGKRSLRLREQQDKEAQEEIDEFRTAERNPNRVVPMGKRRYEE
jgi:hypothetical protein